MIPTYSDFSQKTTGSATTSITAVDSDAPFGYIHPAKIICKVDFAKIRLTNTHSLETRIQ